MLAKAAALLLDSSGIMPYMWNEARHDVDHKGRELDTQEGIRAGLPLAFSIHYLPMEKCKAFYEEN